MFRAIKQCNLHVSLSHSKFSCDHLGKISARSEKFFVLRFIFSKLHMQLALDVHEVIIRLIASRTELEPAMERRTRRGEDTTDSWTSRSPAQLYAAGRLEIMASDVTTRDL